MKTKKMMVSALMVLVILIAVAAPVFATSLTLNSDGINRAYAGSTLCKTAWMNFTASGGGTGLARVFWLRLDGTQVNGSWKSISSGSTKTLYSVTIDNDSSMTTYGANMAQG